MKKALKQTLTVLVLFMILSTIVVAPLMSKTGNESEFSEISQNLEAAMNSRDFHLAKEHLDELYPLMKQNIKESKKELNQMKKSSASAEDLEAFQKRLDRKGELYEAITHLTDVSPAALRAKSDDLISMVREFNTLTKTS